MNIKKSNLKEFAQMIKNLSPEEQFKLFYIMKGLELLKESETKGL